MSVLSDHVTASASSEDDSELSPSDLCVLSTDYDTQRRLTNRSPFEDTKDRRSVKPARYHHLPSSKDQAYQSSIYAADDDGWDQAPSHLPTNRYRYNVQAHRYDHHGHQIRMTKAADQRPRPLVEYIKNEWRYVASDLPSPENSEFHVPFWLQICMAPKIQRSFLILIALACLAWGNWKTWAGPRWNESIALDWSIQKKQNDDGIGWFGSNMRPQFFEMVHSSTLEPHLLPSRDQGNRLIVVGDVRGCHDELSSLLSAVQYQSRNDHLIFTGNLIGEGPASDAVAELAINQGASCVRGSYEDRVLLAQKVFLTESASGVYEDDPGKR